MAQIGCIYAEGLPVILRADGVMDRGATCGECVAPCLTHTVGSDMRRCGREAQLWRTIGPELFDTRDWRISRDWFGANMLCHSHYSMITRSFGWSANMSVSFNIIARAFVEDVREIAPHHIYIALCAAIGRNAPRDTPILAPCYAHNIGDRGGLISRIVFANCSQKMYREIMTRANVSVDSEDWINIMRDIREANHDLIRDNIMREVCRAKSVAGIL